MDSEKFFQRHQKVFLKITHISFDQFTQSVNVQLYDPSDYLNWETHLKDWAVNFNFNLKSKMIDNDFVNVSVYSMINSLRQFCKVYTKDFLKYKDPINELILGMNDMKLTGDNQEEYAYTEFYPLMFEDLMNHSDFNKGYDMFMFVQPRSMFNAKTKTCEILLSCCEFYVDKTHHLLDKF
jgi:hypothetical protein